MSTPAQATVIIETLTAAGITTVPVAYPNVPFTPPTSGSWVKQDIIWGQGRIETKDGRNAVVGVLQLAIFSPKDAGDGAALTLVETVRAVFNRERSTDVCFGAASGPVPRFEENWRSLVVSVPFTCFETVT